MHPLVGLLALHGFVLAKYSDGSARDGVPYCFRIKRQNRRNEKQLQWCDPELTDKGEWRVNNAALLTDYTVVPWDELPKELEDTLTTYLIDALIALDRT